ncbi:ABATE domain-containing protein, partial [Streptomyces alboniger]|uniref:ABATE domain-containing protein n=1 Tax=Streptomyces alboniger TaxID=132473 RepID=UPI0018F8B7B1
MALGTAPAPYELRFDSGRSCLDLVATRHPVERLDSVTRLRAWLVGAGLVPTGASLPGAGPPWLTAFLELRSAIEQLVLGEIEGAPADGALERVNTLAAPAPPRSRP